MTRVMNVVSALGSARASRAVSGASPETGEAIAQGYVENANKARSVAEQSGGAPNWAREARALPRAGEQHAEPK
jgi:hypothetical protein